MLYIFRLLFLLIDINQETVLNWFGIEDPTRREMREALEAGFNLDISNLEKAPDVSINLIPLIIKGLWENIQDGLTLADIENILFFILFIRFIILALRYNLKTSFYITCIGLVAGYLWYRHLIDLISMYRNVLLRLPFLHKLGMDAIQLRSMRRQMVLTDLKLSENAHWYNPGQVLYYGFIKGITEIDPETGFRYYIDPVSMFISNLQEPTKSKILPLYYNLYNKTIPKIYNICNKFWTQLSGVAAYAVITRIGKKYCPYLVRWHWTFLLIIGMIEQIFIYFIYRVHYFITYVIIPQKDGILNDSNQAIAIDPTFDLQIAFLNMIIASVVILHIGFIIFGLFHAIWGQYFYVPFFVENTELHIGPRPKNSIYSGGQTSWQDPDEYDLNRVFPKFWYGWFGRGTNNKWPFNILKEMFKKITKRLIKLLKR